MILPGGYGTFDVLGELIGGTINKLYDKPIAILNYGGFYDTLIKFLDEMQAKDFSKVPLSEFVFISINLDEILDYFKVLSNKRIGR